MSYVPYSADELQETVLNTHGIYVPYEVIYGALDGNPYLTPEDLYCFVCEYYLSAEQPESKLVTMPKGFTAIDFAETHDVIIPEQSGNYIWLLKEGSVFPQPSEMNVPVFNRMKYKRKEYRVMYTGKASNLHDRLRNHLNGNIARSTLRKSLAALFGFRFESYQSGKKEKNRITQEQETYISNWLRENCVLLFKSEVDYSSLEEQLIIELDPPLNIEDNPNINNGQYVAQLSRLRNNANNHSKTILNDVLSYNKSPHSSAILHDLKIIVFLLIAISLLIIILLYA